MTERPLLILPEPSHVAKHKGWGGSHPPHFPTPERQVEVLGHKFGALEQVFLAQRAFLQETPLGTEPERVLVLETVGTVEDFYKAVRRIHGLEWLTEWDEEDIPPNEDFYKDEDHREDRLRGRLYLVMTNYSGLGNLLSLWREFRRDPDDPQFQWNRAMWRDMFRQLRDIHPWGPTDRLRATGLLEDWEEQIRTGQAYVSVEIELWFRQAEADRQRAQARLSEAVLGHGGTVMGHACVPEISYHGAIAELPASAAQAIAAMGDALLVRCNEVMFLRPGAQMAAPIGDHESEPSDLPVSGGPPVGDPVVALLDGMPVENHPALAGRLIVDDPDGWSASCPVKDRHHGTAMASLIVHGELGTGVALSRPLYVRPVLKPDPRAWVRAREAVPGNLLAVDLLHRAVRRLYEGTDGQPAAAPSARIVNLSIGERPFDACPTPLARLVDYLAWRYDVLFLVSAGNYEDDLELDLPRIEYAALRADKPALARAFAQAWTRLAPFRRIRSPGDSINAITVGALHDDSTIGIIPAHLDDPFGKSLMPSPIGAQGPGFRRSIKPDVFLAGGRQTFTERLGNTHPKATAVVAGPGRGAGQLVAAPPETPVDAARVRLCCGTSNATALASRTAALLWDVLEGLRGEPGGDRFHSASSAALLKTMLVHGATWGSNAEALGDVLGTRSRAELARCLGYGAVNHHRVMECAEQRATLIGWGRLDDKQAHLYRIPLPGCLSGRPVWRRLTVTLGWISPINPAHNRYRRAALEFDFYDDNKTGDVRSLLRVRSVASDGRTTKRGTVQHEVYEGSRVALLHADSELRLRVNCRAEAGGPAEGVPYGLAVTLETGEEIALPIYQEVRARIRLPVIVSPVP